MEKFLGTYIRIFVKENARCKELHNKPINKIIAEFALELGISDFVEYKAMGGYVFDKKLHTTLREIVEPELPIIIEIFTDDDTAQKFIEKVRPYLNETALLVFRDIRGMFFR